VLLPQRGDPVHPSVRLSHSRVLLETLDGMICHFAEIIAWPPYNILDRNPTLREKETYESPPQSKIYCQIATIILLRTVELFYRQSKKSAKTLCPTAAYRQADETCHSPKITCSQRVMASGAKLLCYLMYSVYAANNSAIFCRSARYTPGTSLNNTCPPVHEQTELLRL